MISGQSPAPSPEQDHEAHIQAHLALLELSVLQNAPAVLAVLFSHIFQHVSMKAREMVDQELKALTDEAAMGQQTQMEQQQQLQLLVQTGAIDPASAQQMAMEQQQQQPPQQQQFAPEQIEARVAQIEAELVKEITPLMTYKGNDAEDQDPLVDIRMQELSIKEMEAQHKLAIDQAKLELEGMKIEQRAVTDSARLELQEQIADDRSDVNRERIDVQRQATEQRNSS